MEQNHINILTLKKLILIVSNDTKRAFIDKDARCFFFEKPSDADKFCTAVKGTSKENKDAMTKSFFCTELYSLGARQIVVQLRDGMTYDIPIEKSDCAKQYYNEKTNLTLTLLQETKEKKYLREMKSAVYIVPIVIESRTKKMYPVIHYCQMVSHDNKYTVVFTTLKEFEAWNKDQKEEWSSLEMDIMQINRFRKGNKLLINPLSDKVTLNNKHIRTMLPKE